MSVHIKPAETVVWVRGLAVQAQIGIGAPERRAHQTLLIDLEMTLENPAIYQDKMAASVNYVTAVRQIEEICGAERMLLLETLAEKIAAQILEDRRVRQVTVSIAKPHKMPHAQAVGVRRTFDRREN